MLVPTGAAWRKIVIGALPLAFLAGPAVAADPVAIADEIVAALVDATRTATYETATAVGEVVTITNLVVSDPPNGIEATIAEIIVTNPVEIEAGGFTAQLMVLRNGSMTDLANTLRFENVELANIVIPPVADLDAEDSPPIPVSDMIATGLRFEPPQANPLVIERMEMHLTQVQDGVPYSVAVSLNGVEVPLSLGDNSQPIQVIRDLGFETLFMDFNVAGNYDSPNDTLNIESVGINIRDFGHIDVAGVITGVAFGQLQEPGGPEEILAAAMVNNVTIRFENGGAIEAFLREQAELTNLQPQDVAFGLAAAFQIFLRTLENPTLEQQVGQAVGAFLRNPRALTVVATPPEPVPLMEVIGLLLTAPTIVPSLLNIVVTAND
ncbi:MAG: hypothetical protein KIT43_14285 [Bauldia sp.]|nr:hypothetical protein [Bauldia sp.]MCW5716690.1 hypothetical protein [Bauldia sp.]